MRERTGSRSPRLPPSRPTSLSLRAHRERAAGREGAWGSLATCPLLESSARLSHLLKPGYSLGGGTQSTSP